MSEKRFKVDKEFAEYPKLVDTYTNCFYHFVDDVRNVEIFCERLNKLVEENEQLKEENERLRNQLERKTILLKIRTKHIDDRVKSFHELLTYLESFCYKSNIDGNYAKQDIINILNNWEIREYD